MVKMGAGKVVLILLSSLVAWLVLLPAGTTVAQEGIEVTSNRAALRFPDTVTFRISAAAPAEIADVTLTYGTNARSCQSGGSRQRVDFEPGSETQAEWEWELKRSGSIPPGSTIWWTWTIEDDDGNTFTTKRKEMPVRDDRYNWRTIQQNGVTVNWFSGDADFAEGVLAAATSELQRLSAEIGVEPPEEVQLWLYPTADDVRDALVISADWTGAVAFPSYQIMILSLAPGQESWAAAVIPHELTHLVVGVATHNCRGGYLPVWLSEGLAVYGEGAISARDLDQLERALQEERLPALRDLADGFSAYGEGAHLAYTQSGEIVRFMLDEYGPEQMDALMAAVRDGLTIDRALEQVYGFDTGEMDARWRSALGYTATPTSAAAQALEEATPTAVPTLALVGPPVAVTPTPTPWSATATPSPSPTQAEPVPSQPAAGDSSDAEASPVAEVAAVTPAAADMAEAELPENAPSPDPTAAGESDESSPSPLPWIAGIGLGVAALVAAGYFVIRKGE